MEQCAIEGWALWYRAVLEQCLESCRRREAHAGSAEEDQSREGTEEGTDHREAADEEVLGSDCSLHSPAILWEEEVEKCGWGKVF